MSRAIIDRVAGFDQVATVYGEGDLSGRFDQVLRRGLRCRLAIVGLGTAAGPERAQLAETRRLLSDPEYELPDDVEVEVDGVRYRLQSGTQAAQRGPSGQIWLRSAEVVRQR